METDCNQQLERIKKHEHEKQEFKKLLSQLWNLRNLDIYARKSYKRNLEFYKKYFKTKGVKIGKEKAINRFLDYCGR